MNRRHMLAYTSAVAVGALLPMGAVAQTTDQLLADPGPLPEKSFGAEDAPVTVIEYASMTCGHCRNFHVNVWPQIKEKYVDTGQVRFVMREFPLDPRATAAFMLARCSGDDKWYGTIDLLYRTQEDWARASGGAQAMKSVMGMTGMDEASFEACLADDELNASVTAVADRARELGVDSTPTFFINGTKYAGVIPLEQFSAIVDPLISAAQE